MTLRFWFIHDMDTCQNLVREKNKKILPQIQGVTTRSIVTWRMALPLPSGLSTRTAHLSVDTSLMATSTAGPR
jgi:hypothetical protein